MRDGVEALSRNPRETGFLAALLVRHLQAGDVVCLDGDLGAGKTTFVTALMRAFGGDERVVTSPTFTLENRYPLPSKWGIAEVVHADLYRMGSSIDPQLVLSLLEAREMDALVLVEWAFPLREILRPCWQLQIRLDRGPSRQAEAEEDLPRVLALSHSDDPVASALVEAWRKGGRE